MAENLSVKVNNRYQITIPSIARNALHIEAGDRLLVDVQDGVIVLIPQPVDYVSQMAGLQHEIWEKVDGDEYLANERDAWTE